ncbi:unnamed protein product, partial [Ectocarpus sp. 12 AP-2014]
CAGEVHLQPGARPRQQDQRHQRPGVRSPNTTPPRKRTDCPRNDSSGCVDAGVSGPAAEVAQSQQCSKRYRCTQLSFPPANVAWVKDGGVVVPMETPGCHQHRRGRCRAHGSGSDCRKLPRGKGIPQGIVDKAMEVSMVRLERYWACGNKRCKPGEGVKVVIRSADYEVESGQDSIFRQRFVG